MIKRSVFAISLVLISIMAAFAQGGGFPYKSMEKYLGKNFLVTDPVTGVSKMVPMEDYFRIDSFYITGDTLWVSMANDSIPAMYVVLPESEAGLVDITTNGTLSGDGTVESPLMVTDSIASKFRVNGTNLYPKSLSYNLGLGTSTPGAQLELTKNIKMVNTTYNGGNPYGIVYKGTSLFLHDFNYGNNGTVTTTGQNLFFGENAGNTTMGSTATQTYHSSYNVGIGYYVLNSNTTGGSNFAMGTRALNLNTSGSSNLALGYWALRANTTGSSNVALGYDVLKSNTTAGSNTAIGNASMSSNTTGGENTAIGSASLFHQTTGIRNTSIGNTSGRNINGSENIFIGFQAANQGSLLNSGNRNIVIGVEAGKILGTGASNILLGYKVELALPNTSNQLNIGNVYYATGLGTGSTPSATGKAGIGTSTPTATLEVNGDLKVNTITTGTGANILIEESGIIKKKTEADPLFTSWNYNFNNLTNVPSFTDSIYVDGDTIRLRDGLGAVPLVAGPQGPAGADGTSVTILGSLDDELDLPVSGDPGDAYLIDGDLWVWDGSDWINVGTIQGPAGATGATGPQGPAGDTKWTTISTNIYNNNPGYVGINTSTPQAQLDVNGQVRILDVPTSTSDSLLVKEAGIIKHKVVDFDDFVTTESDPVYGASSWATTTNNSSNWDTAYGWGDHSTEGYITSYSETDPVYGASSWASTTNNSTNWNAAYGWGDHSTEGYLTSESDPTVGSHIKAITAGNISNWNAAYGYGPHTGLYRPISYVPAWSEITSNPFSFVTPSNNQMLRYNSTSSKWENFTPTYATASGTVNYLSKFTSASAVGNSLLYDNGTNIGLGTADPLYKMHIAGTGTSPLLYIENTNSLSRLEISGTGSGYTQSDIRLNSNNTLRGMGLYTFNSSTNNTWYIGNAYSNNDKFVINRRAAGAMFQTNVADPAGTNVNNLFSITSDGYVGIGVASPTNRLQITNPVGSTTSTIFRIDHPEVGRGARLELGLGGSGSSGWSITSLTGGLIFAYSNTNDAGFNIQSWNGGNRFSYSPNTAVLKLYNTSGAEKITFDGAAQQIKLNGSAGNAGQTIISQGPGSPTVWGTAGDNWGTQVVQKSGRGLTGDGTAANPLQLSHSITRTHYNLGTTVSGTTPTKIPIGSTSIASPMVTPDNNAGEYDFTINTGYAGYYRVSFNFNIERQTSGSGTLYINIYKNGNPYWTDAKRQAFNYSYVNEQMVHVDDIILCNAGDVIDIRFNTGLGQSVEIHEITSIITAVY